MQFLSSQKFFFGILKLFSKNATGKKENIKKKLRRSVEEEGVECVEQREKALRNEIKTNFPRGFVCGINSVLGDFSFSPFMFKLSSVMFQFKEEEEKEKKTC